MNAVQSELYRLAAAATAQEQWRDAEKYYAQAIAGGPPDAKLYLYRGWQRAARSRTASSRGEYTEALTTIVADYEAAHNLAPDDDAVSVSLVEAEICAGRAVEAIRHAVELAASPANSQWRALSYWLGAVASALAGSSGAEPQRFPDRLKEAAEPIAAGIWHMGDVTKYLDSYAGDDCSAECAAAARSVNEQVLSAVEDLKRKTAVLQQAVEALTKCLSQAADYLRGTGRDLPDETISAAAQAWEAIAEADIPETGALKDKVTAVTEAYARIMIALSGRRMEEAEGGLVRSVPREHTRALYLEAVGYTERAACIGGQGDEVRAAALDIFRKASLFMAATMHDGAGAVDILERARKLFPDEQQLVNQMATLRQMM